MPTDRGTMYLLPPSLEDWLPEDHLARFIVEMVNQLDLGSITNQYRSGGSLAYHPSTLLSLLLYGYATGVYSSRKIEQATYDSIAFRYLAGNTHPDHDTLATFRRRFLGEICELFTQTLLLAREMNLLKMGLVALDGTKMPANASRHHALSYGHAVKQEARLEAEVEELLKLAEQADQSALPAEASLPEELKRRQDRLARIKEAKVEIEARARTRFETEQAAHEAALAKRGKQEKQTGKKAKGRKPKPPESGPKSTDQVNLTDEESRIMPVSGGGFEQAYNAQAVVEAESMLVLTADVTQAPTDRRQLLPALQRLEELEPWLGSPEHLLADAGYFSEANVQAVEAAGITPLIAAGRECHHPHWRERFQEPSAGPLEDTPLRRMLHRMQTQAGRALYAKRKHTVEPVFGIIKHVMRFRQFLLRGLSNVLGEWNLVCLAWNLRRMAVLRVG